MNGINSPQNEPRETAGRGSPWPWLAGVGCLLILLIALLLPKPDANPTAIPGLTNSPWSASMPLRSSGTRNATGSGIRSKLEPAPTPEEIVARKLNQFARGRREILHSFAKHLKVAVPAEAERFFDLAEAGDWEALKANFESLKKLRLSENPPEGLPKLWPVIMETFGVAEAVHQWPAQKLLDYGETILGTLRPDMVYVGGTDPGRFFPTLLNETTEGERHVVLTQNALADNSYLEYVRFLYHDRLALLTEQDSQRAFQDYLADAQKRLQHDQQFPDEPKQIRPGEDVHASESRVQVSGQVAVMAINERLFQMIMDRNPEASFAIEQSFPLTSTYAEAAPLGPIMELRVREENNTLNADRATQAVDYWRTTAQELLSDPEAAGSLNARMTYGKMAAELGGLLLDRKYPTQAEEAFRIATEICPSSPEAVFRYVNLLMTQNRVADAIRATQGAVIAAPDNAQFGDLLKRLNELKK